MNIKFMSCIFTALIMLYCAADASGQNAADSAFGSWANVKSLAIGQRVVIKSKNGAITKGFINQVADDSLTVIGKKQKITLAQSEILQINTMRKTKGLGLLGGIVGGIAGFAGSAAAIVPIAADNGEGTDYLTIPVIIAGTAGGAVLGNRIGGRERKGGLVYQSK